MAKLAYIPETLVRPREKPGVYLAIHPADRPLWFETLVKEIRGAQDCVVWFDEEPEEPWDEELHLSDMEEMNLIVFPVTTRFLLQPNRAREAELPHAMKQRIPILPIMMETGLEELFERCFGDVQYLDRAKIDLTAIPYAEKLKNFLASILVGDELAAQVRAAFDAYIFLSYRKKDRKEAQELMRLIHQNDFCQSVAIWYDEFLVPGENFNGAIEAALRKSHLFALAVTPNLTERPNYVELYEYPKAKDAGVPVIPVQMAPTVRSTLETAFPGIPEDVDGRDSDALSDALLAGLRNIALRTKGNDPRHTYFMGLAYLNGIDVEIDRARGTELITQAADAGLPEAMGKLVTMCRTGEGVDRDYMEAIRWQEKLTKYWKSTYDGSGLIDDISEYLSALQDLGEYWYERRHLENATRIFQTLERDSGLLQNHNKEDVRDGYMLKVLLWYGTVCEEKDARDEAKVHYANALNLAEKILKEADTQENQLVLARVCYRLGEVNENEQNKEMAFRHYSRAFCFVGSIIDQDTDDENVCRLFAGLCIRLGDFAKRDDMPGMARMYYGRAAEIIESMNCENNIENMALLYAYKNNLAERLVEANYLDVAYVFYEEGLGIALRIMSQTESIDGFRMVAASKRNLGSVREALGDYLEALRFYEESLSITKKLADETETTKSFHSLVLIYDDLARVCELCKKTDKAKMYREQRAAMAKKKDDKYWLAMLMPILPLSE